MKDRVKIFIDGSEGTTGLRIHERFEGRDDIDLLSIDPLLRKDRQERKRLINESDITFLCLPDEAARESVSLVENDRVRIIDTSTAHRTSEGWAYGFPELFARSQAGHCAGRPGCGSGLLCHGLYLPGLSLNGAGSACGGLSGELLRAFRLQRRRKKDDRILRGGLPPCGAGSAEGVCALPGPQAFEGDEEDPGTFERALVFPHCLRILQRDGGVRSSVYGSA